MSTKDLPAKIASVHALYCRLTGFDLRLDMAREQAWYLFFQRELTEQDLRDIIQFLRSEIREGRRNPGCLKFRNLISNIDYLEEDLAECRARRRYKKPDAGRADVLQATGRPVAAAPPPAREAAAIAAKLTSDPAAASAALDELKRLKASL